MISFSFTTAGPVRKGLACLGVCLLAACADDGTRVEPQPPSAPAAPAPDYATTGDHFADLQRAGLSGRYAEFARHLKAGDPKTVTDALQRSFRGGPFDVYTRKSGQTGDRHQRMVELRSATGRLYLYVELGRVPGGWIVAGHDLSRQAAPIQARL